MKIINWLDKQIFDKITYFLWDISQYYFNNGDIETSNFIEKLESKISRKWFVFALNHGLDLKPMSETSKMILQSTVGAYIASDCGYDSYEEMIGDKE